MQFTALHNVVVISNYIKRWSVKLQMLVNNTSKGPPAHTALHNPVDLPNSYQNIVRPTKISRFPVFLFEVL